MTPAAQFPTGAIEQIEDFPAQPVAVWDTLIVAALHAEFTGHPATSDARIGGAMTAGGDYIKGVYRELDRPGRIVQTWRTSDWPDGYDYSRLEFRIETIPNGARLTMVHTDVPEPKLADFDEGWKEHYWEPLRRYFAAR